MKERYPLNWPDGWKRTVNRQPARFRRETHAYANGVKTRTGQRELSASEANERVLHELQAMGVVDYVVSTNLTLTSFGTPRSGQREPTDPGVTVYWESNGKSQCMAIDLYDRVADNLAAIAASLEALRAIERHGGAQIMERAFLGFAQLPASTKPWRVILQIPDDAEVTEAYVTERFRTMAAIAHPDKQTGAHLVMAELNAARAAALAELRR